MRQFITLALSLGVVATAQAQGDVILRQSGTPDRVIMKLDSAAIREQITRLQNQLREMSSTMQLRAKEISPQMKELQNKIELNVDGLRNKTLALRERDLASEDFLQPMMRKIELAARRRPLLGITVAVEPRETDKFGAYIDAVTPGSPAAKAGILAGDVIVRIGGKSVVEKETNPGQHLIGLISTLAVGKPVDVELRRGTQAVNVKVTPMEDNSNIAIARSVPGMAEIGRLPSERIAEGQIFRNFSPTPERNVFSNNSGAFSVVFDNNNGPFANIELTSLNEKLGSYFGATEGVLVVNVGVPRDIAITKMTAPAMAGRAGFGGGMLIRTDSVSRKTAPAGAAAGGRGGAGAMTAPAEAPRVTVRSGRLDSGVTYIDGVPGAATVARKAPVNIPVEPGDVIVSVDGRKVTSPSQLMRIVGTYDHNDEFKLQIIRQKRSETLTIKMP